VAEDTQAARADVLAARAALDAELEQLKASAKDAGDIPGKVRDNPAKAAGIAAGAGFLLLGGPKRVYRGVKEVILGPDEPLPPSLLPKDVEKTLKKMGTDGARVRGTLERDFAEYLEDKNKDRRKNSVNAIVTALALTAVKRGAVIAGRRIAESAVAGGEEAKQRAERDRER
jgi:hypothetical protein